jgi:hypothetical protein
MNYKWEKDRFFKANDRIDHVGAEFRCTYDHYAGDDFAADCATGYWQLQIKLSSVGKVVALPPGCGVEIEKPRQRTLMGEFALILAAKGHLVGYEVLEQLADVAIGDV